MAESRFHEKGENRFSISLPSVEDPTQIVCPVCKQKAVVTLQNDDMAKLTCVHCSYNTTTSAKERQFYWGSTTPTDGFFGAELWLQIDCAGHSLWAFNCRHIEFLEDFVSAKHRQRNPYEDNWHNSSLASRLPKWMKSAKNREHLLKGIEVLKEKAN